MFIGTAKPKSPKLRRSGMSLLTPMPPRWGWEIIWDTKCYKHVAPTGARSATFMSPQRDDFVRARISTVSRPFYTDAG